MRMNDEGGHLFSFSRWMLSLLLLAGFASPSLSSAVDAPTNSGVSSWGGPSGIAEGDSYVQIAVRTIYVEDSRRTRNRLVVELAQWVRKHSEQVSRADIDALAFQMGDADDGVRLWTAGALGSLGARAGSAVPILQEDLRDRPCDFRPATSAGAIRLALVRIGVQPTYAPCLNSGP